MAILVALAAIIIPIVSGMIGRAETSGRATNSQEIYKWIQTYQASFTRYPSDWDALTDGTAAISYVNGFTGGTAPLQISTITDTAQIGALRSAGITRLQLMDPAAVGSNRTFNPYLDPNDRNSASGSVTITSGTTTLTVATLTSTGQFQLNLSDNATTSTGVYVVFGFGKRCTLVGSGVNEAPFNFFDSATLSPDTRYSRYGIVFQVAGAPPTNPSGTLIPFAKAKLVRVFRFGNTLQTGDDAIKSYWDDVTQGGGS
jgi:hypothetical protein